MDFEARLHRAAQRLIPQNGNSGYPLLVVYYHRRPPFVMSDEYTPVFPLQLDPDLLQATQWLATKADFLVIAANGPHILQAQLEQAASCKVLSMIELTLEEVRRRNWSKIGVLGFPDPRVAFYTQPLSRLNLAYEVIEGELQTKLNASVLGLMEGRDTPESTGIAQEAVATLRARNVDGIILGCTELPLLLHEDADEADLINPAQLLAEAAVRYALT
jgi:aspartate racemase